MKKILFLVLTLCACSGMSFSDIIWDSPTAISTVLTDASEPQVVIDASNNATAVWVENGIIKTSSLPSGGSWSAVATLSNVLNTSSSPQLAIDSSGNVTALWIENTAITSARLPSGGSWGASATVSSLGATSPVLAVDSSGNAVAVWERSGFIESSTRISGLWSLVSVISLIGADHPHVAISDFGIAMAAWHATSLGNDIIPTALLNIATNTWLPAVNVFSGTASFKHNYPKIALDVHGNAIIAWFRYNLLNGNAYENVQVLSSPRAQGASTWALASVLSEVSIRNPADLQLELGFDTDGDAVAVWTTSYDGMTFSIESARKLFGQPWPEFVLTDAPSLYSFAFDLSNSAGNFLLTSMTWDGSSTINIQSSESNGTNPVVQAWSAANVFSTGDDNGYPKCAVSRTGSTLNAVAVWTHFDGVNNVIHAATGSDTVIDPPSDVNATQSVTDFGVYQDYYNTITWTASSDPNLIQYSIFRDGVYFAATDPGTLTLVDHNATQGGTVTYGVAGLTSDYRQSDIIEFTLNP